MLRLLIDCYDSCSCRCRSCWCWLRNHSGHDRLRLRNDGNRRRNNRLSVDGLHCMAMSTHVLCRYHCGAVCATILSICVATIHDERNPHK